MEGVREQGRLQESPRSKWHDMEGAVADVRLQRLSTPRSTQARRFVWRSGKVTLYGVDWEKSR